MAEVITMPRLSDTMEEGTIVEWFKQVGEEIAQGDVLAEVETDKANMELESFYDGTLLYVGVEQGDVVPVDKVIAVVGEEGEDYQAALESATSDTATAAGGSGESSDQEEAASQKSEEAAKASAAESDTSGTDSLEEEDQSRIKASPLAKKLAAEKA